MSSTTVQVPEVTVLFAGDSGDGMQLTGSQFTLATAMARNDLATLPDFPAEIRAPAGTLYGVSGFQLHFGSGDIHTAGDEVDLLVAMNPAALAVNLHRVRKPGLGGAGGGAILVNTSAFAERDLQLAGLETNPLEDGSLEGYQIHEVELTRLTREALADTDLSFKEVDRCKNMFALGLALWMYTRPIEPAREWISKKFEKVPAIRDANLTALEKGAHYGDITESFANRYEVEPADLPPGTYRAINGNAALALGLTAAGQTSGLGIFYSTYPITPASDLLHALSRYKAHGVKTFQAEDEIAAIGAAIGAAFGGNLGVTGTSGPGMALKGEFMGLATMTELPLVVIDVQRAGPSTGMPTKTEQSDLLMAVYGRNGEAPTPVLAARTPGDCFEVAYNACRVAARFMTPVIVLSDGYLGNGSEPWRIPDAEAIPDFSVRFAEADTAPTDENGALLPYARDEHTLARPWARPGTAGLEHRIGGLEKDALTGGVSYDPQNHQHMTDTRQAKLDRIAAELAPLEVEGDQAGDVLVVAWGSTYGSVKAGVERAREQGVTVGHLHLRWLNPMAPNLPDVFARYRHILVPELNNGQLHKLLRERYLLDAASLPKVQGLPFSAREIGAAVVRLATGETANLGQQTTVA
ncbi:MAG: 2-oxoacid:acceptor oxidoreductase subunit alpha [Bacteroidota bacterium]